MMAWLTMRAEEFAFTSGHPTPFRSTPEATRRFCADCGAQLTFEAVAGEIDITAASLDEPEAATPIDEIWTDSRIGWMDQVNQLPRFRGGGAATAELGLPPESALANIVIECTL